MNKKNIYKLFFKDYFNEEENGFNFNYVLHNNRPDENTKNIFNSRNEAIKNVDLKVIPALPIIKDDECLRFKLLYPGLLTGIGLVHDSKKLDGAYNLGMHFDYTYGMPIVYGSSVKGVLREYFKEFYKGDLDVADLIEDIFSGKVRNKEKDKNDKGKLVRGYDNKSIYDRDVFFDAVIVEDYEGRFLEDDSITPHPDPLKNPVPIKMLKIAPGCKIEFRFRLCNTVVGGMKFSVADKLDLFKKILTTVGIGAKTNVGYGQLKTKEK
mgnify:CR=1 FL=1